jgi:hypothetical protein
MAGDTTIKTRAPNIAQPTEMQQAQNRFAVAVKNHTAAPNPETLKELQDAQQFLYSIEDLDRQGSRLKLEHAWAKREKPS